MNIIFPNKIYSCRTYFLLIRYKNNAPTNNLFVLRRIVVLSVAGLLRARSSENVELLNVDFSDASLDGVAVFPHASADFSLYVEF